jgi:arylesterase/paraoxonase
VFPQQTDLPCPFFPFFTFDLRLVSNRSVTYSPDPVFPDVVALRKRLHQPDSLLDSSMKGEAGVLRLVKAKDYEPELLYWDDGSLITVLTAAAIDPKHGKLIAGGVVERYFLVCDIDV